MSISIIQSAVGNAAAETSFTITFSTAPVSGRKLLLIASISTYSDATRQASVTGFTANDRLVNGNSSMMVLSKTTGASENTSYTVSVSGAAEFHSGIMYEIAGADNNNFYNAIALANSDTTPSRTPTVIGVLPITSLALDNAPSLSAPSGWSSLISAGSGYHGAYSANRGLGTDTSTSYNAVWSGTESPVSAIILVNPAAAYNSMPPKNNITLFSHLLVR